MQRISANILQGTRSHGEQVERLTEGHSILMCQTVGESSDSLILGLSVVVRYSAYINSNHPPNLG